MDADELFIAEGGLDAARDLAGTVEGAELFLYPGDQHLFADSNLPAYNERAATLLMQRTLTATVSASSTSATSTAERAAERDATQPAVSRRSGRSKSGSDYSRTTVSWSAEPWK